MPVTEKTSVVHTALWKPEAQFQRVSPEIGPGALMGYFGGDRPRMGKAVVGRKQQ